MIDKETVNIFYYFDDEINDDGSVRAYCVNYLLRNPVTSRTMMIKQASLHFNKDVTGDIDSANIDWIRQFWKTLKHCYNVLGIDEQEVSTFLKSVGFQEDEILSDEEALSLPTHTHTKDSGTVWVYDDEFDDEFEDAEDDVVIGTIDESILPSVYQYCYNVINNPNSFISEIGLMIETSIHFNSDLGDMVKACHFDYDRQAYKAAKYYSQFHDTNGTTKEMLKKGFTEDQVKRAINMLDE